MLPNEVSFFIFLIQKFKENFFYIFSINLKNGSNFFKESFLYQTENYTTVIVVGKRNVVNKFKAF